MDIKKIVKRIIGIITILCCVCVFCYVVHANVKGEESKLEHNPTSEVNNLKSAYFEISKDSYLNGKEPENISYKGICDLSNGYSFSQVKCRTGKPNSDDANWESIEMPNIDDFSLCIPEPSKITITKTFDGKDRKGICVKRKYKKGTMDIQYEFIYMDNKLIEIKGEGEYKEKIDDSLFKYNKYKIKTALRSFK